MRSTSWTASPSRTPRWSSNSAPRLPLWPRRPKWSRGPSQCFVCDLQHRIQDVFMKTVLVLAMGVAFSFGGLALGAPLEDEPIQPIPLKHGQDPSRAELGRRLFRDPRLSANGRVSCASCHDLAKGGA